MIDLLKPNGAEAIGLIIAAIILVIGIILIWRAHRYVHRKRRHRDSPEHLRELRSQRQKHYESLPPGQL